MKITLEDLMKEQKSVTIIGGGLAGCEAAWQLLNADIYVKLIEMRPIKSTPAHSTDNLCELVCSNSFRSDDKCNSAIGLLHEEMRLCNSIIMKAADTTKVPAGSALAVDRNKFSQIVEENLYSHKSFELIRSEQTTIPKSNKEKFIIATGPLTSETFSKELLKLTGEDSLDFFDAIAPIIYKDTIDFSKAWYQSRYDKPGPSGNNAAYINCPLDEQQYNSFIKEICTVESIPFKKWEKETPYFEGCLPIEVMAERGKETLRYGPMKPVGLSNPRSDIKPHAVVQLRQDNEAATMYNMVGFQTKLSHKDQIRIFSMIPGLEKCKFARLGGIHRNTFINSPLLLDSTLRLKKSKNLRFAGQITGVEGYVESAAIGLLAGKFLAAEISSYEIKPPPKTTALGSLLNYVVNGGLSISDIRYQPMNINFGLIPEIPNKKLKKKEKRETISKLALSDLNIWLN
tara:strand:- start:1432 stop:2802 length:1371 start_codon:yes stop_codon:yes gene_type:complete